MIPKTARYCFSVPLSAADGEELEDDIHLRGAGKGLKPGEIVQPGFFTLPAAW